MSVDRHRDTTKASYESDENVWKRFNKYIGGDPDKYSIHQPGDKLIVFAHWRATTNARYRNKPADRSTIIRNLYGIKAKAMNKLQVATAELPLTSKRDNPKLWALLNAVKKTDHSKIAINAHLLSKIMHGVWDRMTLNGMIRCAVASISHNTIRRIGETLQSEVGGLCPSMIAWDDGSHYPKPLGRGHDTAASIRFSNSKTNKTGKRQTALLWCQCALSTTYPYPCGFCDLRRLYRQRGNCLKLNDPIFRTVEGKVYGYRDHLDAVQTAYAKATGRSPKEVGTHSHRKGGYQDCKKAGYSMELILAQGFWTSVHGAKPYEAKNSFEAVDAAKRKFAGI